MPQLIAETVDQEENVWKIYDNFSLENIYYGTLTIYNYDENFMSHLKRLERGKQYFFDNWLSRYFDKCFRLVSDHELQARADLLHESSRELTPFYPPAVIINVYGFEGKSIKCKECGFETDLKVCPNCGEWN